MWARILLPAGRKGGGEILKCNHGVATFVMELRTVRGLRQKLIKHFHRGFTCSHKPLLKPQVKQLWLEKGNRNCREGSEGAQRD